MLTVAMVRDQPRLSFVMFRLQRNAGGTESSALPLPVVEQRIGGRTLTFRTRSEDFYGLGGPREAVENEWSFELLADDEAVRRSTWSSRFSPAKARGENVPPPPPLRMRRDRS